MSNYKKRESIIKISLEDDAHSIPEQNPSDGLGTTNEFGDYVSDKEYSDVLVDTTSSDIDTLKSISNVLNEQETSGIDAHPAMLELANEALANIFKRHEIPLNKTLSVSTESHHCNPKASVAITLEALSLGLKTLWDGVLTTTSDMFKTYLNSVEDFNGILAAKKDKTDLLLQAIRSVDISHAVSDELDIETSKIVRINLNYDGSDSLDLDIISAKAETCLYIINKSKDVLETANQYVSILDGLIESKEPITTEILIEATTALMSEFDEVSDKDNKYSILIGDKKSVARYEFSLSQEKDESYSFSKKVIEDTVDNVKNIAVCKPKDLVKLLQFNKTLINHIKETLELSREVQKFYGISNNLVAKIYKENAGLHKQGMNILKGVAAGAGIGLAVGSLGKWGINKATDRIINGASNIAGDMVKDELLKASAEYDSHDATLKKANEMRSKREEMLANVDKNTKLKEKDRAKIIENINKSHGEDKINDLLEKAKQTKHTNFGGTDEELIAKARSEGGKEAKDLADKILDKSIFGRMVSNSGGLVGAGIGGVIGGVKGLFSKSGDTIELKNTREVLLAYMSLMKFMSIDTPLLALDIVEVLNIYCEESIKLYSN